MMRALEARLGAESIGDAGRKSRRRPLADDARTRSKLRSTEWFGKPDRDGFEIESFRRELACPGPQLLVLFRRPMSGLRRCHRVSMLTQ